MVIASMSLQLSIDDGLGQDPDHRAREGRRVLPSHVV